MGIIYFSKVFFTLDTCELGLEQDWTPKVEFPQSALFPKNDSIVKFTKGPPNGISPDSWLKDKFKYLRNESASKDLGIGPEGLL